ncbi:helix-turn-helix domain-containing protein [Micromonospora sp. NPDC051300]|uniref:helix-turn-helix domain-containing protein n=1 Tax=Micromonospora sp. NPDC051300 TaxID=3364286 RepID=UPI0037BE206A
MNEVVTHHGGGSRRGTGRRRYRLAQRRKAVGLSQEHLAEILGVDRSTVVRWERAETDPQPWHRPHLATALRVSVEELADLLADAAQPPPLPDERLDHALRRPGHVDLITVGHLRERVRQLDERYDRTPSALLLAEAAQVHGQVSVLRQHATGSVRRDLAAALAESATLLGQLVWDATQRHDHTASAAYFDQAIDAAKEAGDPVAQANALLRKSYLALYGVKRPTAAIVLIAQAAAVSDSHVLTGLALLHRAEAHAMLGQARNCSEALASAEKQFATMGAQDPASALYCPSHHARLAGSCWLSLDRPADAITSLRTAHQLISERRKSTAVVLGNLAIACIRHRDLDMAISYLHQTVDVIERTRAGGGLNLAFAAARQLRPWRDRSAVQDAKDRLHSLMTP